MTAHGNTFFCSFLRSTAKIFSYITISILQTYQTIFTAFTDCLNVWSKLMTEPAESLTKFWNKSCATINLYTLTVNPVFIEDYCQEVSFSFLAFWPMTAFPEEYMALSKGKEIPEKSLLSKICPWLDNQGVIPCSGQLQFAESLPHDVRIPVILPRGQWVTRLIVKHFHEMADHSAETNFVLLQVLYCCSKQDKSLGEQMQWV